MGTAPRKQLAAVSRKQPKRSYKIPRSLKKGIKRNLVKIVKDLHAEVSDSRVPRFAFQISHWLSSTLIIHLIFLPASN